ncbi:hypothetical protein [Limimaricola soesokkakensis]
MSELFAPSKPNQLAIHPPAQAFPWRVALTMPFMAGSMIFMKVTVTLPQP